MADDLDGNDLAEVRRRVVDPVLAAVLDPGELTVVSLDFGMPGGWEGSWADDGDRRAWLVLTADGGESRFEHPIGKAMFWRSDTDDEAARLAGELDEWIGTNTRFGWGSGHSLGDYVVPELQRSASADRVLEVYPGEEVSLPLWERGVQVASGELPGLSAELASDLIAWHRDRDAAVAAMHPDGSETAAPTRPDPAPG